MKKIILALFIFATAITYGQDVQIEGKAFQTVRKKVLNTEIECYQLREKGNTASKSQSYIKRGEEFTKTIFSETELKNFISTGKVSSFGIIKEKRLNEKQKLTYILKSDILVLISKRKNTVKLLEIHDKVLAQILLGNDKAAKSDDNGGQGPTNPGRADCVDACFDDYLGTEDGANGGCLVETVADARACEKEMQRCVSQCPAARGVPSQSIHLYSITLKKQIL